MSKSSSSTLLAVGIGAGVAAVASAAVYGLKRWRAASQLSAEASKTERISKKLFEVLIQSPHKDNNSIIKIVLTGGPCAGKTTALARVTEFLQRRGVHVLTVPEAATLFFTNGATVADTSMEGLVDFQAVLLTMQLHLENTFCRLAASTGQPAVVLCDRGAMDGRAYMPTRAWDRLLEKYQLTNVQLRDDRYNAVAHLVTAANGAEKFYTVNTARHETIEEAIAKDEAVLEAWTGHSNCVSIDNSTDFEGKMQRLVEFISSQLGLPRSTRRFRKYLLQSVPTDLPIRYEEFRVVKVYIRVRHSSLSLLEGKSQEESSSVSSPTSGDKAKQPYAFVRERKQGDVSSYGHTIVTFENGQRIERKRIITKRTYEELVELEADPEHAIVHQRRICFVYNKQYFEIYQYLTSTATKPVIILNCQIPVGTDEIDLPPFLSVEKEVTHDRTFSAYMLSKQPEKRPARLFGTFRSRSIPSPK